MITVQGKVLEVGDTAVYVELSQGYRAIIDYDDFNEINNHKWSVKVDKRGIYAVSRLKETNKNILMHRFILKPLENEIIDHINGNGLDNRRCNLRIANKSKNAMNQFPMNNKSSIFKGVSKSISKSKPWKARIKINGKEKHLGLFFTEEEAAIAYNNKAIELFGEFAKLNVIPTNTAHL